MPLPITTVGELRARLAQLPDDLPVVKVALRAGYRFVEPYEAPQVVDLAVFDDGDLLAENEPEAPEPTQYTRLRAVRI